MPRQMTASTLDQDARAEQDPQTDLGEWPEAFAVADDGDAEMFARPGIAEADHQVLVDDDLDDDEDDDIDDEDDADDEDVEDEEDEEKDGDAQRSAVDPDDDGLTKDDDEDDDEDDDDDFDDDDDDDDDAEAEAEAEDEK